MSDASRTGHNAGGIRRDKAIDGGGDAATDRSVQTTKILPARRV
jgi:hypothetical protein